MNYPEYVEVKGIKYKINTDFRVAIKCNKIAQDETIGDLERVYGIICTLFEEKAFDEAMRDVEVLNKLMELAKKYLKCGKEDEDSDNEKPDMDLEEDMDYIRISFISDYNGLDIKDRQMHFWEFMERIEGLSNSELGNCCILNRIRNLRDFDVSQVKDSKEREKIRRAKEKVALKKEKQKKTKATKEQEENALKLYEALGINVRKE